MQPTRRRVIVSMTSALAAMLNSRNIFGQNRPSPQPLPSPNAPANENAPTGLNGADIPVRNGGQTIPPATWLEIKSDAQKMLDMATDFKAQIDRTNLTATLSLPLIQEAHKMEKLAKQIQSRMKQ